MEEDSPLRMRVVSILDVSEGVWTSIEIHEQDRCLEAILVCRDIIRVGVLSDNKMKVD